MIGWQQAMPAMQCALPCMQGDGVTVSSHAGPAAWTALVLSCCTSRVCICQQELPAMALHMTLGRFRVAEQG